jgi:PAS domain S-box-containing protein
MAVVASLLSGIAVLAVGGSHIVHHIANHAPELPRDTMFMRDVWISLGIAVLCANVAALAAVITTMRRFERAVAAASQMSIDDERERLQQSLSLVSMESDRNRAIIDTVFASVFAVDGGGRIISANPAAVRMFALPADTLHGVVLSDLIAADSLRMSVDEFGSVTFTGDGNEHRFTTRIRLFGRPSFPADVAVTPLALEGQRAWAVFVHDLTEKVQAEIALEDARIAAVSSSRSMTAFLARMSHELRAPLNSMIGFTKIVRRSRSSQLGERDRHYLDRVQAGSEHLLVLVSDILDLSRIESGTIELNLETIDIAPIVREIVLHHEDRVADRPVVLESELPDGVALATVDAARLRQVLTNLVGNAVKFTARGSVRVAVSLDQTSGFASAILVCDTGIGIPLERQSQIFESFEQGGEETSHRYGGSGLGLALSRRIAQQMGCMLSVESMPGAGSTFTLVFAPATALPLAAPEQLQSDAA